MPKDKKRKFRLRKPEVSRVDIVDRGANQHSHILLAKRDEDRMPKNDPQGYNRPQAPQAPQAPQPSQQGGGGGGGGTPPASPSAPATPSNPLFNRPASPGIGQTPPTQRTPPAASGAGGQLSGMAGQLQRMSQATPAQRPADQPGPGSDDPEQLDMDEDELLMNILRTRMKRRQNQKPPRKSRQQAEPTMAKALDNTLELITKGLVSAGVFTEDATAEDLRDILPRDVVSTLTQLVSAKKSADSFPQEDSMTEPELQALVDELPDEIVDYLTELEERAATAETELAKRQAEAEVEVDDDADPIAKALATLPEDVAAIVKSQQDRLQQAEEALAQERIAKADEAYVSKARSFDGIIDKPEDFGPVLRKFAESHPEAAEALESQLRAASSRVAKSDLFAEFGHEGAGSTEVETQIEAVAKSYQEANPELSSGEARALAWENNPEMYGRYVAEKQSR